MSLRALSWLLTVTGIAGTTACATSTTESAPDVSAQDSAIASNEGAASCFPGASAACVGAGGCAGGQVCAPDGKSLGPCVCGGPTVDASVEASVSGVDDAATTVDATVEASGSDVDATVASDSNMQDSSVLDGGLVWDGALPTALSGAVQKGPFVRNSSVTVQELDSTLTPTGRTFQVSTSDDEGDFTIPVTVSSRYVEVIASGFYFDELTNQLSSAQLTLRALADLASGATVEVTLLTSMSEPLVRKLVAGGASFPSATTQAESAVLSALGFSSSSLGATFASVGLTGGSAASGEALAVSLIVEQYARQLGTSEVAQLSQVLGEIGAATAEAGGDAELAALNVALCQTIWAINPARVRSNLTGYYASLGASVTVPPFEQSLCGCGITCSGTCVDQTSDQNNCGSCGNVCATGATCASSTCVCPSSGVVCSGACVDETTDRNNCGSCGNVCASGATCTSSTCVCPSSGAVCSGACVDETKDGNNCGACGAACGTGQSCLSGTCVCTGTGCTNPTPTVTSLSPASITEGSAGFTLTLSGSNFVAGAAAYFGGTSLQITYLRGAELQAAVPAGLLTSPGTVPVYVVNPTPGGGTSGTVVFTVSSQGDDGGVACATPCSVAPPSTAQCIGGDHCLVTLASGQNAPIAFTVDTTSLYWTDCYGGSPDAGTIESVSLGGGAVTTLASGQTFPYFIVVDSTSVYWTDANAGTVMKAPRGGGTTTTLASGQNDPVGIAVDAVNVYWTNYAKNGSVMKLPLGGLPEGGAPITVAAMQNAPVGLVVDANNVYWINQGDNTIMKAALDGGAPVTLALANGSGGYLAVDSTSVYWTNEAPLDDAGFSNTTIGSVMKVSLDGGALTTLATGQNTPQGVAVDSTSVYWTSYTSDGGVMKAPLTGVPDGGSPTVLAAGQSFPLGIAVDTTSVYWNNYTNTGGTLMRLTPK